MAKVAQNVTPNFWWNEEHDNRTTIVEENVTIYQPKNKSILWDIMVMVK